MNSGDRIRAFFFFRYIKSAAKMGYNNNVCKTTATAEGKLTYH